MEDAYKITGGRTLKGEITLSGAKNVALKAMIGALLFDQEVILEHAPKINDVFELMHLIKELGGRAEFLGANTLLIDGRLINKNRVDFLHASKIRVSFMLFAPLLYKFKTCYVPNPGGCRIGARPIDRIIKGMEQLGITIAYGSHTGYYEATIRGAFGGTYHFDKPSHTGTELLILLAVFANKETTLTNCACEPEIDELIKFLNEGGARIRKDKTTISIVGVSSLKQTKPFRIISDRNEAVTFATLALATKGDITLKGTPPFLLEHFVANVREVNGKVEYIADNMVRFSYQGPINHSSVETAPHPGFMTDWQSNWAVLMTQAQGESIIHERVFENRFSYVSELRKLGAKIDFITLPVKNPSRFYFFNFHRTYPYQQAIKIYGPRRLHNAALTIGDLRAGATLVIASLVAHGDSVVQGASILERGYEHFEKKVQKLGGEIKKV